MNHREQLSRILHYISLIFINYPNFVTFFGGEPQKRDRLRGAAGGLQGWVAGGRSPQPATVSSNCQRLLRSFHLSLSAMALVTLSNICLQ